jgi:hypothetical protein
MATDRLIRYTHRCSNALVGPHILVCDNNGRKSTRWCRFPGSRPGLEPIQSGSAFSARLPSPTSLGIENRHISTEYKGICGVFPATAMVLRRQGSPEPAVFYFALLLLLPTAILASDLDVLLDFKYVSHYFIRSVQISVSKAAVVVSDVSKVPTIFCNCSQPYAPMYLILFHFTDAQQILHLLHGMKL